MYKSLINNLYFRENSYMSSDPEFIKIGEGRSASVFKIPEEEKVIKIFFPGKEKLKQAELSSYRILSGLEPYFLTMHDDGENFLILDYVEGKTVYEYLTEGIFIEESIVTQVDKAIQMARNRGLNPSDVHLKNMMIKNNHEVKLIDLARFQQNSECRRWEDLKKAYYTFYVNPIFPKKISSDMMEQIATKYKENPYFRK